MKKSTSVWLIIFGVIFLIGIIVIIFIATGVFQTAIGRNCNLGSWYVKNYDKANGKLIISADASGQYGGCLGTYRVSTQDAGGLSINNKGDCEEVFGIGSWRIDSDTCILSNDNWFKEKTYIYSGKCMVSSCIDSRNWIPAPGSELDYKPGFDGFVISFPNPPNAGFCSFSCSGDIIVDLIQTKQPEIEITETNLVINSTEISGYNLINNKCELVSSNPQYSTLSECQYKIILSNTGYIVENGICKSVNSNPKFNTLPECQESLKIIEKPSFWNKKTFGIKNSYLIISLISIIIVFITIFAIMIRKYRR